MNTHKSITFLVTIITLFLFNLNAGAQESYRLENVAKEKVSLEVYEDSLVKYAEGIRNAIIPQEKAEYNEKFVRALKHALSIENSYKYPFERLKPYCHIVSADDNAFRVFNWVIIISEFQRKYYAAIQTNKPQSDLYPLFDKSEFMDKNGKALISTDYKDWYGGEIYNIMKISTKHNGSNVYAFFAYNNNGTLSKKKILDHLAFGEDGPVLGVIPIHTQHGSVNRMIIEYKKDAFVNLNYNKEQNKIIFDRLMSDIGDINKRSSFVPSGHLDGLIFKNNSWNYVNDAIPVLRLQDGQAPIDGAFPR